MAIKILFVCTGNSFRSPVAEALYNKMMTIRASSVASNAKKLLEKREYIKEKNSEQWRMDYERVMELGKV